MPETTAPSSPKFYKKAQLKLQLITGKVEDAHEFKKRPSIGMCLQQSAEDINQEGLVDCR